MNLVKTFWCLVLVALLLSSVDAFSGWRRVSRPGQYGGRDAHGGIICLGTSGTCFTIYYPRVTSTSETAKCIYVPSENWGLIDIDDVNGTAVDYGNIYQPVTNNNTVEVKDETVIVNYMNKNYGAEEKP